MANVNDVIAEVVGREGSLDVWKLQKLLYYCQAWHLVWDSEPLFPDRIEAWANGPVVRSVYAKHRGQYHVNSWKGSRERLTASEQGTIDSVLDFYGGKTGHELIAITHREAPWKNARKGLAEGERGDREITKTAMAEYYGGLVK